MVSMDALMQDYRPGQKITGNHSERTVLVGGCFDILHYGHIVFLQAAKQEGDALIVALESDDFIRKLKERNPVHTQHQRATILASLRMVDRVLLLPLLSGDEMYQELVESVRPAVIGVTQDDPFLSEKQQQAASVGATVKTLTPMIESFSSTAILEYAHLFRD